MPGPDAGVPASSWMTIKNRSTGEQLRIQGSQDDRKRAYDRYRVMHPSHDLTVVTDDPDDAKLFRPKQQQPRPQDMRAAPEPAPPAAPERLPVVPVPRLPPRPRAPLPTDVARDASGRSYGPLFEGAQPKRPYATPLRPSDVIMEEDEPIRPSAPPRPRHAPQPSARLSARPDAGVDAGVDAGESLDAAVERALAKAYGASSDAGVDAGVDAGRDAGRDAGVDAGRDAGVEAYPYRFESDPALGMGGSSLARARAIVDSGVRRPPPPPEADPGLSPRDGAPARPRPVEGAPRQRPEPRYSVGSDPGLSPRDATAQVSGYIGPIPKLRVGIEGREPGSVEELTGTMPQLKEQVLRLAEERGGLKFLDEASPVARRLKRDVAIAAAKRVVEQPQPQAQAQAQAEPSVTTAAPVGGREYARQVVDPRSRNVYVVRGGSREELESRLKAFYDSRAPGAVGMPSIEGLYEGGRPYTRRARAYDQLDGSVLEFDGTDPASDVRRYLDWRARHRGVISPLSGDRDFVELFESAENREADLTVAAKRERRRQALENQKKLGAEWNVPDDPDGRRSQAVDEVMRERGIAPGGGRVFYQDISGTDAGVPPPRSGVAQSPRPAPKEQARGSIANRVPDDAGTATEPDADTATESDAGVWRPAGEPDAGNQAPEQEFTPVADPEPGLEDAPEPRGQVHSQTEVEPTTPEELLATTPREAKAAELAGRYAKGKLVKEQGEIAATAAGSEADELERMRQIIRDRIASRYENAKLVKDELDGSAQRLHEVSDRIAEARKTPPRDTLGIILKILAALIAAGGQNPGAGMAARILAEAIPTASTRWAEAIDADEDLHKRLERDYGLKLDRYARQEEREEGIFTLAVADVKAALQKIQATATEEAERNRASQLLADLNTAAAIDMYGLKEANRRLDEEEFAWTKNIDELEYLDASGLLGKTGNEVLEQKRKMLREGKEAEIEERVKSAQARYYESKAEAAARGSLTEGEAKRDYLVASSLDAYDRMYKKLINQSGRDADWAPDAAASYFDIASARSPELAQEAADLYHLLYRTMVFESGAVISPQDVVARLKSYGINSAHHDVRREAVSEILKAVRALDVTGRIAKIRDDQPANSMVDDRREQEELAAAFAAEKKKLEDREGKALRDGEVLQSSGLGPLFQYRQMVRAFKSTGKWLMGKKAVPPPHATGAAAGPPPPFKQEQGTAESSTWPRDIQGFNAAEEPARKAAVEAVTKAQGPVPLRFYREDNSWVTIPVTADKLREALDDRGYTLTPRDAGRVVQGKQ